MKLKVQTPFTKTIKWKDCQMDPIGICFADSILGIKHFQDFKKADEDEDFESVKTLP